MGNPMYNKSPKGYDPYELMSGLQKYIRRSREKEALFCFYELEACGLFPHAKNRLMITVYEDVGIANENLMYAVKGLCEQMESFYKQKNGAWRLVLANIILSACRGSKSRISDHFACSVAADMINGYRVDFDEDDFVLDMHTRRGKAKGRGYEHFDNEATLIIDSDKTLKDDYREEEIIGYKIAEENGFSVLDDYTKSNSQLTVRSEQESLFVEPEK